jgi:hypothetical protein
MISVTFALLLVSSITFATQLVSPIAIVRIPSSTTTELKYEDFPCSETDRARITQLINFFAENSYPTIRWRDNHLRSLWAQLYAVHPLKFLGYSMTHLSEPVRQIFDDYFKKLEFMWRKEGLGIALDREARRGALAQYLVPFAEEVGSPPERLEPYFLDQNWEGLILELLEVTKKES